MKKSILAILLVLVMSVACLAGCSNQTGTELNTGGVLCLSVNPEIAVHYDADGNVTKVEARNDDGGAILKEYSGYAGKPVRQVVAELVTAIGEAGYFVDDIDGERREITIEIERGSKLPSDAFLDEVADEVRECVGENNWNAPLTVRENDDDDDDVRTCTNPNCDDDDCDDVDCDEDADDDDDDVRTCTNPNCDDDDCDDAYCDEGADDDDDDVRTCTNPNCDDDDCDDAYCDEDADDDDDDVRTCTNPNCDDDDCDDVDCDEDADDNDDDVRTCTNPNCDDDDCDDADCDED